MRRTAPVLLAAAVGLGAVSAASAAPIRLATEAERPFVFVDRQGVAHMAYSVTSGLTTRTFYRRALPGSRTFSGPVELATGVPGTDFSGAYITQDPAPSNRVVLVTTRCCTSNVPETYALTSLDGGVTWSAAVPIADPAPSVNPTTGRVNTVANGQAGLYLINGNPSMRLIKVAPSLAPVVARDAQVDLSPNPLDGQVVVDPSGTPYFGHLNFAGNVFVRVGETGADVSVSSGSTIVPTLKLAAGARGAVALTITGTVPDTRLETRVVTGGTVGAPVPLAPSTVNSFGVPWLSADQTGRYHAVWREDGNRLIYRRSENGTAWSAPQTLVTGAQIFDPVASAGPDGNGWVVWEDATSRARVFALPLSAEGDPSVPDLTGITNPRVTRRGSTIVVSPRTPRLADLRRTKCVRVRVQSTRPASIRVAIFSGRRSIRIFGATVVRFPRAGKKVVCIRVPLRARTFNVRQPFRFAFATRFANTPPRRAVPLVTTPFTFFR